MNNFSKNLKQSRKIKGWTQAKAAEEISRVYICEITESVYQNWELERGEPNIDLLIKIIEVFNIDDMYLFLLKPIKNT